jgi:hypothetical protein
MGGSIAKRADVIAWLLCAVLTCLAIHSPHCDLCDGPLVALASTGQSHVDHPKPTAPDTCNGICWCCGFHGLPNARHVVAVANKAPAEVSPEPSSPALASHSAIFRPPRLIVSA